jgi:hypothetical protein
MPVATTPRVALAKTLIAARFDAGEKPVPGVINAALKAKGFPPLTNKHVHAIAAKLRKERRVTRAENRVAKIVELGLQLGQAGRPTDTTASPARNKKNGNGALTEALETLRHEMRAAGYTEITVPLDGKISGKRIVTETL